MGASEAERDWLRSVGMRVRLARVAARQPQEGLAERAGVSRVTVGSIERGEHPAVVLTYVRVALTLGVPLAELLAVAGSGAEPGADRAEGLPS